MVTLLQTLTNVNFRLVCKTALEDEGWRRILPILRLFEKYNLNPNQIELESSQVYHPLVRGNSSSLTFTDAIQQNMVIFTMVFCNTMTPGGDNSPHAVTIYKKDQNDFVIKNSYFNKKEIPIDSRVPVYSSFMNDTVAFRQYILLNYPTFSDDNCILFDYGFALRFKDKVP